MVASVEPVLAVVRCPDCGQRLSVAAHRADEVVCPDGHRHPLLAGRAPDLVRDPVQPATPGQLAMRFRPLVRVYESVWRPLFTAVAGGTDPDRETAVLAGWLGSGTEPTVLDVACGPGNTTRRLAAALPGATVVGADLSVPMLERAVADTPDDAPIGFARVDAHRLPVDDASLDAVHCAAALYLLADPGGVVAEIGRALRPGGRFVGMTIVSPVPPRTAPGRAVERTVSTLTGLRYLGAEELRAMCTAAGLEGFRSERRGAALLFSAQRLG